MSNATFKRNYAKLLERAGAKAEKIVRRTGLELFGSLVMKSPVDTGRFRSNWQVGDRQINVATDSRGSIANAAAVLDSMRLGAVIFLTNSLPYAYRLEHGWSKQAPQGMVKLTVVEYRQHIAKVVREMQ